MKKNKQFPAAMILLAVVSAVCYKGMRAIENKLKAKKEKSGEVSEMRLLPSLSSNCTNGLTKFLRRRKIPSSSYSLSHL